MYLLQNQATGQFARHDSTGEHDGRVTDDVADAKEFATWAEASDFSQNFGADFTVCDMFGDNWDFDMGSAARAELPEW